MAIQRMKDYFEYMTEKSVNELDGLLFDHQKKAKRVTRSGMSLEEMLASIFTDDNTEKPTADCPFTIVGEEWMGGYSWIGMIEELRDTIQDLESHGRERNTYLRLTMNLLTETVDIYYVDGLEYDLELILIGSDKRKAFAEAEEFFSLGCNYDLEHAEGANDRRLTRYKGMTVETIVLNGLPY